MKKTNNKQKDLGIFYTPKIVVDFIFDILKTLKEVEDKKRKRWVSNKPKPHFPSVIDPACGEGIFLKKAIERKFTMPDWVFGLDIDKEVVKKWKKINLLKLFNDRQDKLDAHFFHQNGLDRVHWEQHKNKYYGKLRKIDIEKEQFDTVVGNPPYGGLGLESISPELERSLYDYKIWKSYVRKEGAVDKDQLGIFGEKISYKERERLTSFPIEILFIDRFVQLAKSGGWIAIIIPDGILANSTYDFVRRFIAERAKVLAIVSLPRDTFKDVGTTAKTSILFLKKVKNLQLRVDDWDYTLFLSSISRLEKRFLDKIVNNYKDFILRGELSNEQ